MTQIFESYSAFLKREDKKVNGVDADFAKQYPDHEKQNESNEGCWNCSGCFDCSDCSGCSDCSDCSGCFDCSGCSGCSDCSDCSRCFDCFHCSDCSGCSRCSGCYGLQKQKGIDAKTGEGTIMGNYPTLENIHQRVLEAASPTGALEMGDWHTCDTTHCRGGWAVHLAGEQGKKLEQATSTLFAAMMIYKASSKIKVAPTKFFLNNEESMADMKRCAEEEKLLTPKT
jgi:hypothetical protein